MYQKYKAPIIGLQKINKKDCHKYGMIKGSAKQIDDLLEKPKIAPSALAITGKYIVTAELLKDLQNASPGKDKELRLIDGMKKFIRHSPIYGHEIKGQRYDTGDKLGYLKAVVHFGLKHKDLKHDFKKYLHGLDF